jgi:hypothetical protein
MLRRIEMIPPGRLAPNKRNARTHSAKQLDQIARSIERFGFVNPVLIDDADQIIAGHGRVEAAKRLGLGHVPVLRVTHLSAAERTAYALADNRLADLSGWDPEILAIELQGLLDLNFDIELTGFQIDDVKIVRDQADNPRRKNKGRKDDRGPLTSSLPVSRAGDEWLLGGHQLRCADIRNDASYTSIDAAIRCWQSAAAQSATLAGTGQTFAEVEDERARTAAPDTAGGKVAAKREAA